MLIIRLVYSSLVRYRFRQLYYKTLAGNVTAAHGSWESVVALQTGKASVASIAVGDLSNTLAHSAGELNAY